MELLASNAPATVANFLSYVGQGGYNNLLIHRAIPGFVVQTGGYTANANLSSIPVQAPVRGEPGVSNIRGTVAMALSTGPNSGTSQWFVNLADNSSQLDGTNDGGPFTVFARVLTNGLTTNGFPTNGMSIVDTIGSLQTTNLGGAFTDLPLQGKEKSLQSANLVTISNITFADPVVTFVGSGTATIAASQPGNGDWKAATNILHQLIIRP
jgi:peptidyl-prolyl cis-trans isomerase A (cyclophilin A)